MTEPSDEGCCPTCGRRYKPLSKTELDRKYKESHPDEVRSKKARYVAAAQAQTRERAHRFGSHWTGPELELVSRDDLSSREVAAMIGRTYSAVRTMRHKVLNDPKVRRVAGLEPMR